MTPLQNITVLIIEDDEAVRETLVDMLELNGLKTIQASDGQEGLGLARRYLPGLIITDLNMPGLSGFELLEHFRSEEALRPIPVIVVSAKADRSAMRRGMELGADDFISKPFTEDEVLHSIATRLEKKELLDELDAFAHTVAHDLKNPLCTLSGRLDLATMMIGKTDDATLRHHLTEAGHSAMRLNDIIEELLVLAGVRRQAIVRKPLDMAAIVTEAVDRLELLLKKSGAKLEKPADWPVAVGHAPWIIEVWVNYLSNAAKYGGLQPSIYLGAELVNEGRHARFWVEDRGPGLSPEAQAKMFIPFSRISSVRATGHGLGLSIVRRIIEKLGGKVGLTSAPEAGARFWFELPTAVERPDPGPAILP